MPQIVDADVIDAKASAGIPQGLAWAGEVKYFAGGIGKAAAVDDGTEWRGDGEAADFAVFCAFVSAPDGEPFIIDVLPLYRLELAYAAPGPSEKFHHVCHFLGVGFALCADVFHDARKVCAAGQCGLTQAA